MQAEYSLLARDAEAELLPAAAHHGAGLLAWAPLGRGVLTGTYADAPAVSPYVEERRTERAARIVQAVLTAAEGLGTSPLAVALAWVRDRPGVAAAVVGARDAAQLGASMSAEAVTLPDGDPGGAGRRQRRTARDRSSPNVPGLRRRTGHKVKRTGRRPRPVQSSMRR